MSEANKPIKQFRDGALSVGVWKREHQEKVFYSATPQRAYLDEKDTTDGKDGTWKYTDSFSRSDLPAIAALMLQAYSFIIATEAKAREQAKA
jgi:hypothetical protein